MWFWQGLLCLFPTIKRIIIKFSSLYAQKLIIPCKQRAQITTLIDRRWPGIHHVLQIAYRTEGERTSGRILALYTTHPITIGLNIRHVIDTRKVWFLWNLLRDVYYIYSFNTKYEKMRCEILSVYFKSVLIVVLQSFNRQDRF